MPLPDRRPVRRIEQDTGGPGLDPDTWPATLAPVRQLLAEGLDLAPGVTILVGENGSGKSTLVEAVATAYGLNPEGGSTSAQHATVATESPLHTVLRLRRGLGGGRWGYFLRAETMHGLYTYLERNPGPGERRTRRDPDFHRLSHGESFLALLETRFDAPGLYCLDEPESALSFSGCLALVGVLAGLAAGGAQVLCATHSPIVAATPGATILQVDADGYAPVAWEDLELVAHWRLFLDTPAAYLRHLDV